MFFTLEDYKKIYEWISRNSIKDTEFNEALTPLDETDTITLIQNGTNVRISLKDLVDLLFLMGVSDFLNITDKYREKNITLDLAIELIPYTARKVGQVITFLDTNNKWKIYLFRGELTQWDLLNLWEDILDIEAHTINSILPDEEDLTKTLPDDKGNSYLSFKDREYNPNDFSGLGRIILRKNIVEIEDPIYGKVKKNVLYQDMFTLSNTIYEIRYDFDLNGAEITIPEGCVLDFQGGCLNNGNVKGRLLNHYLKPEWFGAKGDGVSDDTKPIQQCFDLSEKIILSNKSKYKSKTLYINNNVYLEGNGATIIQSENSNLHQGLIYILKDFKFSATNTIFDGNEPNFSNEWIALWYNFIWCAVGSIHLDSCIIGNSRGHAVRTGNVDMVNIGAFNSNEFAHNVIIENCTINQSKEIDHCGDSLRIERTKNAFINNNKVYGGYSGIRSQLYCSELVFTNNVVRDSVRDVGITVAISENIYISSNECSGHYQHGIEIDAVVDCNVSNNYLHDNRKSGIFCTCYSTGTNEYIWARGVISEKYKDKGYGYQDFGSPDLPNLNTFISNNICFNNGESDTLIGQDGLVYCGNYVDNPNLIRDDYFFQLLISGGSINKSRCFIYDNFFKCSSKDKYAIKLNNYQFDCVGKGNKTNIEKLSSLPIIGECEIIKKGLKSLFESEIMSSYAEYVTDNKAINGKSWRIFYAYELNYLIGDVIITNGGYKIVQYKIRSTNPVDISFTVNQYNDDTWVKTIKDSHITLTGDFKEFIFNMLIDISIGNRFTLEFKIPANTEVFIEDINLYSTSISDGYSKKRQKVYSSKGTSEERPKIPSSNIGHLYYDTTLNKPIWWTGKKWVDATGADV